MDISHKRAAQLKLLSLLEWGFILRLSIQVSIQALYMIKCSGSIHVQHSNV